MTPRREVAIGAARLFSALHALMPPLFERVMTMQTEKDHFEDAPAAERDGILFAPMEGTVGIDGEWRARAKTKRAAHGGQLANVVRAAMMVPRALLGPRAA